MMMIEGTHNSGLPQNCENTVTVSTDVLLDEVRRNRQQFRGAILRHDLGQIVVATVLMLFFMDCGDTVIWTGYLCAFGCFVVGAYFVVDRWRQWRAASNRSGSLTACAVASLADVNHQIWLRNKVLWWYLLPISVPLIIFCGSLVWDLRVPPIDSKPIPATFILIVIKVASFLLIVGFVTSVNGATYWLTQSYRKKHFEPRRRELERLLNEIESDNRSPASNNQKPLGPLLIVVAACFLAVLAKAVVKPNSVTSSSPGTSIDTICKNNKLPALAVVVTKDGQICDRAVAGVRKWGDTTPVTTNDLFHIGSCTKSMTATLAAVLIEEGQLRWDTTIAEIFPELSGKIDKRYETVTVEQLLQHRGGVPTAPPLAAWGRAWQEIGTPTEQRREFIEAVLTTAPAAAPGTTMIYSNQGYSIVGAMLEKISGQDFESLMTEKLFKPMHMETAGFGPPGTKNKIDQPWGHIRRLVWTSPMQSDNPPAIAPAGRVHCSLDDLARYAILHLQPGTNSLLKPESMARLHASPEGVKTIGGLDDYACGWVRLKRDWAGGPVLWHNGSNTMWYVVMWLAPEKNFCVIAATNIAGKGAEKGCNDACVSMIDKWLREQETKTSD